ncbi:WbqC family protein [Akkermansiaceae bacterium]|nr:WbqC family protein [Akkermansiaceae bacterium]
MSARSINIVSIHQPHFCPWGGLLNKILNSDIFVYYDTVKFTRGDFQNRNRIKLQSGNIHWITVPVKFSEGDLIMNTQISNLIALGKIKKQLTHAYCRTKYFSSHSPRLLQILDTPNSSLTDLNFEILLWLKDCLKIEASIVKASDLSVVEDNATLRLVKICKNLGASHYLAGKSGPNYMQLEYFSKSNLDLIVQDYTPQNFSYQQVNNQVFSPGLSVIDAIFNIGPDEVRKKLVDNWNVKS